MLSIHKNHRLCTGAIEFMHECIESCIESSYLCLSSVITCVRLITSTHACVEMCVESSDFMRIIRVSPEYMHHFIRKSHNILYNIEL